MPKRNIPIIIGATPSSNESQYINLKIKYIKATKSERMLKIKPKSHLL